MLRESVTFEIFRILIVTKKNNNKIDGSINRKNISCLVTHSKNFF